ncbi:MAG: MFS transporter [Actinomycetota bacterium]
MTGVETAAERGGPEPGAANRSVEMDSARGWLVVAATFTSTFTVFGVAYSFAPFFGPMADEFGGERSEVALFFAITTFFYFSLGVISGRVSDRVGPRKVLLFGGAAMVLGLLATSQVQSLWVGYLTYGLGVGIGVACAYVPMVATVGLWFERRRSAAMGVAVAGIGVGTLVAAPTAEALIDRYGWRDTYVILAVATAVLIGLASLGAGRPPVTVDEAPVPPLRDLIGRSRAFGVLYLSCLVLVIPLFVPFVFIGDYLDAEGIDGSAGLVVAVIGSSSVVGRLGLGALAARVSAIRLYQGSFLGVGCSFALWLVADTTYWLLVVFAAVFGVAYGGFIALAPAVAADLFGPIGLGGVLGLLYTAAGFGGLAGPPLVGALVDRSGYDATLITVGVLGVVAFLLLVPLRPDTVQDRP